MTDLFEPCTVQKPLCRVSVQKKSFMFTVWLKIDSFSKYRLFYCVLNVTCSCKKNDVPYVVAEL
jgi:hypothetical protein